MFNDELKRWDVQHYNGQQRGDRTVHDWWQGILQGESDPAVFVAHRCNETL